MIRFNKLLIENFMSIGEAEVDLATGGFTLISAINNRVEDSAGSNGSGKSSIAEAIVWCLTGETIRGHKEVVNRYTTGNCKVEIQFEFKGSNWVVKRGMTRAKEKSLVTIKNGQEMSAKGYRDAQEVFSRELPELTFKFINSVIILGQGLPGRFTNNSPAGRKAVLEELTNADYMITQIKEGIKSRTEELQDGLRRVEDQKVVAETMVSAGRESLAMEKENLAKLNEFNVSEAEAEVSDLEQKVSEKQVKLEALDKKVSETLEALEVSKGAEKDVESLKNSALSKLKADLEAEKAVIIKEVSAEKEAELMAIQERLQKGERLIREAEERLQHSKAVASGGTCKLCGQRLSDVTDEALAEAKVSIETETANLKKYRDLYQQLKAQCGDIRSKYSGLESERIAEKVKAYNVQITVVNKKYDEEIRALSPVTEKIRQALKSYMEDKDSLSRAISLLKSDLSAKKEKISGHHTRVSELEKSIMAREEGISNNLEKMEEAKTKVEDYKARLSVVKQMETFASRDFRGILLEGVIDRMNCLIGDYAELVYGNRLTNFYLDGNSIQVEFDGKEYESLSGGEQQKLNVILQLALRDLIVELTGTTGSMLFLDEVFDGLDRIGCEKMIGLFQALDTSIFIITHHSDSLDIPYDYSLTVIKESNGVSYIQKGV